MSRIFFLDANAIYSYYGRDKLGFNSKPVDEKALRRFLLGKELSLPTSVLIEVITHFREDVDKLYDLLQFIRELGLPIYNNMPDYCYEPLTLMVLSNMNKEELKNYSRHLLAKKVEIEAKFVLLFHEITRDLYAEYKLRGTKLSQDDRDRVLNFIGVKGYRDCAKQLEAELVGQLEQGYQNGNS
ncbi:MAG: hypothetical protein IJA10_04025 [Lachnospiraceae bacterium]|nr:hypothetical protein [Lachnospiraceae bacterium]